MAKKGIPALDEQTYDVIQAHILDPEHSPLSPAQQAQFERVMQAARLLDDYPEQTHVMKVMAAKYDVTKTQLRKDIALARELFKTHHTFDWDFTFAWMIKDQMELIRECKLKGDLKAWNNAKKTLRDMIGDKPEAMDDTHRLENTTFVVQVVAADGSKVAINLEQIRDLPEDARGQIIDAMYRPIEEAEAIEIMNS